MALLLEDLAEETSASNRRVAERLDAEVRNLNDRRPALAPEELGPVALEGARLATDYAVSRVPQAEGLMRLALAALRKEPTGESAEGLLRTLLATFNTCQQLVRAARSLGETAELSGVAPERFDELDRAQRRLEELATEAKRALEYRVREWQSAEPERLALGLQTARAGKTVKADEARAWFRRGPD